MTASSHVTIWCDTDGCHEWIDVGDSRVIPTRRTAKAEGWTQRAGHKDFCPDHSRTHAVVLFEGDSRACSCGWYPVNGPSAHQALTEHIRTLT